MLKKYFKFLIGVVLIAFVGTVLSCATGKAPLPIENSLPQDQLTYYSDTFDKMQDDLWERVGYLWHDEQVQNFKQADLRFADGKLIVRTEAGSFSKGGLSSKYALKGDFDIQLDCRMDFIKGISRRDMDQVFAIGVYDTLLGKEKLSAAIIGLAMRGGTDQGYLFCNYHVNGRRTVRDVRKTNNFNGGFRILRAGKTISILYKNEGAPEWTTVKTSPVTDSDLMVGFQVRNFFVERTTIQASDSVVVDFNNFTINAAQQIIEPEI